MNKPLYFILKFIFNLVAKLYYRKIYLAGRSNIPQGVPLIVVANHSNAFWDAALIGMYTTRKVWYLARGDVFRGKWAARILAKLGIAPIYRKSEGAGNLEKNQETFTYCFEKLQEKGAIVIFPEGDCERESRLRPLKKGAARIFFGASEVSNYQKDIYIMAAGINYDNPDAADSELILTFGKPLPFSALHETYKTNPAKAISQLTGEIYSLLDASHINIEHREAHQVFHFTKKVVYRHFVSARLNDDEQFRRLKDFSVRYNEAYNKQDEAFKDWYLLAETYQKELNASGIPVEYLLLYPQKKVYLLSAIYALLLAGPVAFGLVLNYLPYQQSLRLTRKFVKKVEFATSVKLGTAGFLFLFYYLALWVMIFLITRSWILSSGITLVIIFLGLVALKGSAVFRRLYHLLRMRRMVRENMFAVRRLTYLHQQMIKETGELFFAN